MLEGGLDAHLQDVLFSSVGSGLLPGIILRMVT